jgi:hypothetical protein
MSNQLYKSKIEWQRRYAAAHFAHYERTHPIIVADGLYCLPVMPSVITSNGLTAAIINYCTWMGQYANRINTMGRVIKQGKDITTVMGTIKAKTVMIKGSTKRGTPDIDCVINSYPVKLEVKIGKDKQSYEQLKQEAAIIQAGGYYYVIRDIDSFFVVFDKFMNAPKMTLL